MELSDKTLNVLKNYASINPNIVFQEGNTLKTISVARNVMSQTSLEETMPSQFGIYDLNEFLSVLSLVDKPHLTFSDDFVTVGDSTGRSKIKYFFSDPDMLTAPNKDIIMPEADVSFVLDIDTLGKVKRAASVLGHTEISITPSGGSVQLSVVDSKDATSNVFSIDVEGCYPEGADFNFILNVNNLKVVNEDFEVNISKKLISQFKSKQSELEYFIALEKTSKYGE
ncbi:MAG: hypothetical protein CMA07_06475 [Euryarchaeota archaeon]|nr:hypothetical protein [Euryarchaeota archaeon]|tara:strand:- start:21117 stop:21794 length:678 start_codon:yes stop_codon:yes gene_type:complete